MPQRDVGKARFHAVFLTLNSFIRHEEMWLQRAFTTLTVRPAEMPSRKMHVGVEGEGLDRRSYICNFEKQNSRLCVV